MKRCEYSQLTGKSSGGGGRGVSGELPLSDHCEKFGIDFQSRLTKCNGRFFTQNDLRSQNIFWIVLQ
jgi:hypothetical protein